MELRSRSYPRSRRFPSGFGGDTDAPEPRDSVGTIDRTERYDTDGPVERLRVAPALFEEEDAVGAVLAEFVASLLNESALTMEPLGSAVDLDALVTLLRNAESRVEVGFPYEPLYVTVSSTGLVTAEVVDG